MTGQPDCPKCAADNAFTDWLEAHRQGAVEEVDRVHIIGAVASLLSPYIPLATTRERIAAQAVEIAERQGRTNVYARWVGYVLAYHGAAPSTVEGL